MEWDNSTFVWDEYYDSCLYLTMKTGDMKNNMRKLFTAIKAVEYPGTPDVEGMSLGNPGAFVPLYRHAFLDYSRPLCRLMAEKNIDLSGRNDNRFVEGMYKTLREIFTHKPLLTQTQFFSKTYAERKIIMCAEILLKVRERHNRLLPRAKGDKMGSNRKLSRPVTAPPKVDEPDAANGEKTPPPEPVIPLDATVYAQMMQDMSQKVSSLEDMLLKMFQRLDSMEREPVFGHKVSLPPSSLVESLAARLSVVEKKVAELEKKQSS